MSQKTIKTIIALRKDTEANWNIIKDSFKPLNGEVCFVETVSKGLRAKVGDGTSYFSALPFTDEYILSEIDNVVISGYYLNNKFYTDSTYTVEVEKSINKLYIDKITNKIYNYDANQNKYVTVNDTLPTATSDLAGVMKLYNEHGTNTDGTMTQKSITEGISNIKLSVSKTVDECLVLELPW